jgi:hypothetical protein
MGWQNKRIRTSDFCMLNIKKTHHCLLLILNLTYLVVVAIISNGM